MMSASNVLTGIRLLLTLIFFLLIGLFNHYTGPTGGSRTLFPGKIALVLLILTLCTDYLDGYVARWMKNESEIGRIADPLVDKVLICGSLVMFLGFPGNENQQMLQEWMVVVVIARELLVQGVRAAMEKRGFEFAAMSWGKLKMVVQSFSVVLLLIHELVILQGLWFDVLTFTMLWLMVLSTIVSGIMYFYRAAKLLNEDGFHRANV